jgi:hypothetical protein
VIIARPRPAAGLVVATVAEAAGWCNRHLPKGWRE